MQGYVCNSRCPIAAEKEFAQNKNLFNALNSLVFVFFQGWPDAFCFTVIIPIFSCISLSINSVHFGLDLFVGQFVR